MGPSEELDYPGEIDDEFNLIESSNTRIFSYWRNILLPEFISEDEMDDTVFVVVCSEQRAQEYQCDHGIHLFYALKFGDYGKSKTLDELST